MATQVQSKGQSKGEEGKPQATTKETLCATLSRKAAVAVLNWVQYTYVGSEKIPLEQVKDDGRTLESTFNDMTLKVPYFGSCDDVKPLFILLYVHYLIGRTWIIRKGSLTLQALLDQLNFTLQEKYGSLFDPFDKNPLKTPSALSGYSLPERYDYKEITGTMKRSDVTVS